MKKVIRTMVFMIGILLLSCRGSYAAVIQIKDTTATVLTGGTISDFYVMAEELKGTGQGLEGTSVDVKMANNYEWAVVSYFSNSAYGTGGAGQNSGKSINTGVKSRYSTNGNITGVMDWGSKWTYTAGIMQTYKNQGIVLTTKGNLTSDPTISTIVNNAETDKVDKFFVNGNNIDYKIAKTGWYGARCYAYMREQYPYSVRDGLFGFGSPDANPSNCFRSSGEGFSDVTFRPIVWN